MVSYQRSKFESINKKCTHPGSNRGPLACEANVITNYTTSACCLSSPSSPYQTITTPYLHDTVIIQQRWHNNSQYPKEPMEAEQKDYYLVYLRVNGCYFWFNVLQIATTVGLLVCLYFEYYSIVAILQIFITFMVALDLIVRYFTQGTRHFIKNWDNRINIFILLLLVTSIASDLIAPELTHHDGGAVAGIFLFVRYVLQISRLCRLLFQSKKALQLASHQNINLSEAIEQENSESSH